jgi:hypothetical protein
LAQQFGAGAAVLWPTLLKPTEGRGAGTVQSDDLPVKHNPTPIDRGTQGSGNLGEGAGDVRPITAE